MKKPGHQPPGGFTSAARLRCSGTMWSLLVPFVVFPVSCFAEKVETFVVKVPAGLAASGEVVATVPDAYNGATAFPAFLLLHGAGGPAAVWNAKGGNLRELADKHRRIIICPSAGPQSWYNNHNGSERYIARDVMDAAAKRYKLDGDCWIDGNSMGGYGSLRLFANHPEKFSAVLAFSPGTKPSRWMKNWDITNAMGASAAAGGEDTFTDAWLKKVEGKPRPVLMVCGYKDGFFLD